MSFSHLDNKEKFSGWQWLLFTLACCAFTLAYLLFIYVETLEFSPVFNGLLGSPEWQLSNALRRIDTGLASQAPLPFFWGQGVLWLHYPLYQLFGADLFAAELSRYLLSFLLYILPLFVFFRALDLPWRQVTGLSLLFLFLGWFWLPGLLQPDVAWHGVRAALPLLIAATLLLIGKQQVYGWRTLWPLPLLTGLAIFISPLHGAIWWLVSTAYSPFLLPRATGLQRLANTLGLALAAWLSYTFFIMLAHGEQWRGALSIIWIELPQHLPWMLTAPATLVSPAFVSNAYELLDQLLGYFHTLILAGLLFYRRRDLPGCELVVIGLLLAYGVLTTLLPNLVYAWPHQFEVLFRIELLSLIYLLLRLPTAELKRALFADVSAAQQQRLTTGLAGFTLLLALGFSYYLIQGSLNRLRQLEQLPAERQVSGVYLGGDAAAQQDLLSGVDLQGKTLWSEYAELAELQAQRQHPIADSLGELLIPAAREAYLQAFLSAKPDYFLMRENWPERLLLYQSHWPLYEALFQYYAPVRMAAQPRGAQFILWQRQAEKTSEPSAWEENWPALSSGEVLSAQIDYRSAAPSWPSLEVLRRYQLRYSNALDAPSLLLPPGEGSYRAPLFATPAWHAKLHKPILQTCGLGGQDATLQLQKLRFQRLRSPWVRISAHARGLTFTAR